MRRGIFKLQGLGLGVLDSDLTFVPHPSGDSKIIENMLTKIQLLTSKKEDN